MVDLQWIDATAAAHMVATGSMTALEMVRSALERAEALVELGAVTVVLKERAIEKAATAAGPFAGVPILLKDAGQELAGAPYWMGTRALQTVGYRSTTTTRLAEQLEALGFVIIGKAAVPELMTGITTEPPTGPPTRNPWDPTLTVGGSSGGSAAAVAAGIVPLAHGSDSSGSLRYPASCCAVVTLKPTAGRIESLLPAGYVNRAGRHADFVLARSVRDLRSVLGHLSPQSTPQRHGRRIGVLGRWPFGLAVDPLVVHAVEQTASAFGDRGWQVCELSPDFFEAYGAVLGSHLPTVIDASRAIVVDWIEQLVGHKSSSDDISEAFLEAAARGRSQRPADSTNAWDAIIAAADAAADWTDQVDALLLPVMDRPPWPIGTPEPDGALEGIVCSLANCAGQPSAVIPTIQKGLPIGVQLQGPKFSDEWLLDAVATVTPTAPLAPAVG